MTDTAPCSHCADHFQLNADGTLRPHDLSTGNLCVGSFRLPLVVEGPWMDGWAS